MKLKFDESPLVPENIKARLLERKITTTDELLRKAAWPEDRKALLSKINIPESDLRLWVVFSDLVRANIPQPVSYLLAFHEIVDSANDLSKHNLTELAAELKSSFPDDLTNERTVRNINPKDVTTQAADAA